MISVSMTPGSPSETRKVIGAAPTRAKIVGKKKVTAGAGRGDINAQNKERFLKYRE